MVSTAEPYKYEESGLSYVTLVGIDVRTCPNCGERHPAIPRVMDLHQVIAHAIVGKPSRLGGPEVRFLRTYLGRSTEDFAAIMGVTREQVSRWENNHNPIGPQADRLLRLLAASTWPRREYDIESLTQIQDDTDTNPRTLRVARANNEWELGAN